MTNVARRPDGRWRARYRDDAGRERARHFTRKSDAQRWLDEVTSTLVGGTYVDPTLGRQTFHAYAEAWRAAQPHRPTTAKNVEQHLRRYAYDTLGDRPLAAIRPSEVQAWATGLSTSLAPSTLHTIVNTIRAVFAAAVRDCDIAHNPCLGVALPRVPRRRVEPLTLDQVQKIIAATPDQYRALMVVAAGTGLRSGALFGLQVRHIDFLRRTLTVEQQVQQLPGHAVYVGPPKTQSSYRVIPIPDIVVDALAEHLRRFPAQDDGFVFSAPEGGPIVRTSFMHAAWRPAAEAACLPKGAGLHALRHFYASALIRAGLSVRVVSEHLGHANAAMTRKSDAQRWLDEADRTRRALDDLLTDTQSTRHPTPQTRPRKQAELRRQASPARETFRFDLGR